nr:MAG TPA: hypothetical protein [Caudoviricetes sp.]
MADKLEMKMNGLQDYDKGDEVMRRLREYEEREKHGR